MDLIIHKAFLLLILSSVKRNYFRDKNILLISELRALFRNLKLRFLCPENVFVGRSSELVNYYYTVDEFNSN